jgi:hypothetical protein
MVTSCVFVDKKIPFLDAVSKTGRCVGADLAEREKYAGGVLLAR